jgi:hypothetical protein
MTNNWTRQLRRQNDVRKGIRICGVCAAMMMIVAAMWPLALASSAKLVVSWKNPAYSGAKPKRVLVIGMSENPAIRADFEDDMAAAITADGVEVTPGNHILLRPDSPEMDEKYLKGQIRDFKIDGALVSRLIRVDKSTKYVPGSSFVVPYGYYNSFYGYYGTVYRQVYTPGYLQKDTTVRIETNFYSTATDNGELIWTGTSDSFNPGSAKKVIEGVVKAIAKEFKKKDIL